MRSTGRRATAGGVAALALLVAGCGAATEQAAPTPSASASASPPAAPAPAPPPAPESPPPPPPAPAWTVGASPLPLRPDGFGQVLPTPEVLRDRRLVTKDLLPPPPDGRFAATVD